ncbi:MAG TPA: 2'-5' RNA ligase family protein [Parafilimonas sp.]|nr:2'-5' RNA ligase family protein [Parafilimonas sp.]
MNKSENLYFIALIPQQELCDAINNFKNDFATRFKSKRALRLPPHITLKAPFKLAVNAHDGLIQWFANLGLTSKVFNIELKDFGAFQNGYHPVVFINPVMNTELSLMQKAIITSFKENYPEQAHPADLRFKPHLTVAYRDLTLQKFHEAWKEYKAKHFNAVFEVTGVYLLQHDTRQWNIIFKKSL